MLKSKVKEVYDFKKVIVPEKLLEIEISEQSIMDSLTDVAKKYVTIVEIDDVIVTGDIVSVDLESNITKYNRKNTQISVGIGFFNKELEDNLIGMKRNEVKTICINGNSVITRIVSIKRRILPDVTDELIKKLNMEGISTVTDYKKHIYSGYVEQLQNKKMQYIMNIITKEVIDKSEFEIVDEDIKAKYDKTIEQIKVQAAQNSMSYEEFIKRVASQNLKNPTVKESEKFIYDYCITQFESTLIGLFFALRDGIVFNQETYERKLEEIVNREKMPYEKLKEMFPFSAYIEGSYDEYLNKVISDFYREKFKLL